ncbi:prolyl-tRNA synthetase [Thermoplasmatales archaeon BRNA1]|nr:prolyl-tRNA synthetase [Thermoplasmatales archaeon BRNA1]
MPTKEQDFGEWYNETVEKAQLCDKRYPIKGMNVWTPYGWRIMKDIDAFIRQAMEDTGHDEVCFPLLIPETEFKKEKDHIKGFDEEVYWVTHAGLNPLDVRLVVRPTSETAMYPMFSLWVRSHQDLPLKVYQIVNTFRYETKQTRAFMRVREIHFFESHTCHADREDAERQVAQDVEIVDRLCRSICIPYSLLIRTDWDKFPGANYTVGIDTVMPNGRTLQIGSAHYYATNFSKPYEITYEDDNGEHQYAHQTTLGMTERLLGAVVGVHADDEGLILPPAIAPVQIVIVPIFKKDNADEVLKACRGIEEVLRKAGIRVKLDDGDDRPGAKFFAWEVKGVPLRFEVGGRDLENNVVSWARRDNGEKGTMSLDSLVDGSRLMFETIAKDMLAKAEEKQRSFIDSIDNMDMDSIPEGRIVRFGWCGCAECGHKFEDKYDIKILGTPYRPEEFTGKCIVCGKEGAKPAYAARTL